MRNKISKLIAVLLVCIMALGNVSAYAAENIDAITGAGIAPEAFATADGEEVITRGEYAYIMAELMTLEDILPQDTRFTDVSAADSFSGHIEYLAQREIANGYGDGKFGKSDPLTIEAAYTFLLRVLAFSGMIYRAETVNGSYANFAYMIGLKPGAYTNAEGYVTKNGAMSIAYNALTTELKGARYTETDGVPSISTNPAVSGTMLSDVLGVSVYEGTISGVEASKGAIDITVTKNVFNSNPVILSEGTVKTFTTDADTSVLEFAYMPVTIWVDNEDNIVYISEVKGVEVRYVNIYSVNRDTNENSMYDVSRINSVIFYDEEEEYTVSDDATFKVNGEDFTGRYAFAQKFAKVVFKNDEIIHMESWDLTDGGLIKAIDDTQIKYLKGSSNLALRNIDTYSDVVYILDGKTVKKSDIPENAFFSYYQNKPNEYMAIIASSKVLSDVVGGKTGDMLIIGGKAYTYDQDLYYKLTTKHFKKLTSESTLTTFFGRTVDAHLAADGRIKYLSLGAEDTGINEFYGTVVGVKANKFDAEIGEIQMYVMGDEIKKETFWTTQRTVYGAGLDLEVLGTKACALDGSGIFKFQINSKGYITRVSSPGYISGWGEGPVVATAYAIDRFSGKVQGFVGTDIIYFPCDKLFVLYENDGEFSVASFKPEDEVGKTVKPNKISYTLYGDGVSSTPELVVVSGPIKELGTHKSNEDLIGVIKGISTIIDDNDKVWSKLEVLTTAGEEEFLVTEDYVRVKGLAVDKCILYRGKTTYSENEIFITKVIDTSGSPDTWSDIGDKALVRGEIDLIDSHRFILKDGTHHYYAYNFMGICVDTSGDKRTYSGINISDIVQGDTVFYYDFGAGTLYMILVK